MINSCAIASLPVAVRLWGVAAIVSLLAACSPDPEPAGDAPRGALRVEALLAADAADLHGYETAADVRPFRFPDDHGPHSDFRSEWWYLTFTLTDADGREFGVQFTLFRQALAPPDEVSQGRDASPQQVRSPWRSGQVYMGHLALSDAERRHHMARERIARDRPELAGVRAWPFAAWIDGWSLRTQRAADTPSPQRIHVPQDPHGRGAAMEMLLPLRLEAAVEAFSIDISIEKARPLVLQGEAGLSRKGPSQASYYFSATRMEASGTVTVAGETHHVTGLGWYDREWSTSVLDDAQVGWDWFGLRFDDGTDLMVFQLRRDDGERDPHDAGMQVYADGRSRVLTADDFELRPVSWWRDEHGVEWPVSWRLTRSDAEPVTITAVFPNQRMDLSIGYWEGFVEVLTAGERRVGQGYMELTGYD
jgi:predicted secreted hydrolase